jgi:hypothetical protein
LARYDRSQGGALEDAMTTTHPPEAIPGPVPRTNPLIASTSMPAARPGPPHAARPTVSVILPVWNGQRFLGEAIESVIHQSLASLELIVVNDGSTDGSSAIAWNFARQDPRVLVLDRAHAGIADALNTGIFAARAQYIARMDADDHSLPSRLQKQIAFLDAHPKCVVVGSNLEVIDEDGERIGGWPFPKDHPEILNALLGGRCVLGHPSVVMRKVAVIQAGGYRSDHFPSEDLDLWLRLSEIGEFANIPEPLVRYRRHKDAVCVRDRVLQLTSDAWTVDDARVKRGLQPLKRGRPPAVMSPAATYHFECTRLALKSGLRRATIRHASRTITSAPLWPLPYVALIACLMPTRSLPVLFNLFRRVRSLF